MTQFNWNNTSALITQGYRELNQRLHDQGNYGRRGDKWARKVEEIVAEFNPSTILDYGCGQGALARALPYAIEEYDPAIEHKSRVPSPADLVVCTDVLEHVEPHLLENVLDHLAALSKRVLFCVVSTRPAKKLLEDGRNAHLIVQDQDFWRPLFEQRFKIHSWVFHGDEFSGIFTVET